MSRLFAGGLPYEGVPAARPFRIVAVCFLFAI